MKPALTLVHMLYGLAWLHLACAAPASRGEVGAWSAISFSTQVGKSSARPW